MQQMQPSQRCTPASRRRLQGLSAVHTHTVPVAGRVSRTAIRYRSVPSVPCRGSGQLWTPCLFQGCKSRLQADRRSADLRLGRPCPGAFWANHTPWILFPGCGMRTVSERERERAAADACPCIQFLLLAVARSPQSTGLASNWPNTVRQTSKPLPRLISSICAVDLASRKPVQADRLCRPRGVISTSASKGT